MIFQDAAVQFPEKLEFLFERWRYKVAKGGRGGAKSWGFARALLLIGAEPSLLWEGRTKGPRIVCARETQKSIAESVHQLLEDQISRMGLEWFYRVQQNVILGQNGTQFSFTGIRQANVADIKSFESADICWVEEAQNVSKKSWEIVIPTVRNEGSEIWASYNPELDTDDTHRRFVTNPPPLDIEGKPWCKVVTINWNDNPWLPEVLRQEKDQLKERDPAAYEHVWEGMCKQVVEGAIFRNELLEAEKAQRITSVPYEPNCPVYTFWDLGFGDNTSIWFVQSVGHEFRLIDFVSDSQKALVYYLEAIKARPYTYACHYLPHDAKNHELSSGRTIEEQVRSKGYNVRVVPKVSIVNRIEAGRSIFASCWFDADKCADGIQALRHYRYEESDKLGSLMKEPLHDWASHPSDAFTYFAVAIRGQAMPEPEQHPDDELALMSALNERDQGKAPAWSPMQ